MLVADVAACRIIWYEDHRSIILLIRLLIRNNYITGVCCASMQKSFREVTVNLAWRGRTVNRASSTEHAMCPAGRGL
jgi:hypothetical protein